MFGWVKRRIKYGINRVILRPLIQEIRGNSNSLIKYQRLLESKIASDDVFRKEIYESIDCLEKGVARESKSKEMLREKVYELHAFCQSIDSSSESVRRTLVRICEDIGNISEASARYEYIEGKLEALNLAVRDTYEKLKVFNISVAEKEQLYKKLSEISRQIDGIGRESSAPDLGTLIVDKIDASRKLILNKVFKNLSVLSKELKNAMLNEFRQFEAADALKIHLALDSPLPYTRGFAGSPDFLLFLYQYIRACKPERVVELGSGVSTIAIAVALRENNIGELHSLDHLENYRDMTCRELYKHGLEKVATVHYSPLSPWQPEVGTKLGSDWMWYKVPEAVESLPSIDMLIIDGPPERHGPYARYPAAPHFFEQLSPTCVIVLDDANREDEKIIANEWGETLGFDIEWHGKFEKGLAVLNRSSTISNPD